MRHRANLAPVGSCPGIVEPMNPDVTNSTDGGSASASRPGRTGVNIISRLLGRHHHSRETARRRLRLMLAHDRSGIPPELLNVIRSDIIMVISRHVVVDR